MYSVWPPQPVEMVGNPEAIASTIGNPQPSPWVGIAKPSTAWYNLGISSVGNLSVMSKNRSPSVRAKASESVLAFLGHCHHCRTTRTPSLSWRARVQKCAAEAQLEAFEHGRNLKGQRVDNKGKESSGWKIQDSLLQSLITAEEGAGTNTDIQNSQDLG